MILLCIKHSDNPKSESKSFLCEVLQNHCGVSNPLDMLRYTQHGKPVVDGAVFSVSHSDELLCVAVQCNAIGDNSYDYTICKVNTDGVASSIGVDIERIDNKDFNRCKKIAKAKFFDSEHTVLESSVDYVDAFCKMWTLKESYCKYTGVGLPDALTFDTQYRRNDIAFYTDIIEKEGKRYAVSVCYNSKTE